MTENLCTFEKLYHTYYRRMVVYVAGFPRIPVHEREDLAHDILVHAWTKSVAYNPKVEANRSDEQKLNAWLYALAHNFILDRLRSQRFVTVPFSDSEGDSRTAESEALHADLVTRIQGALSKLSERDREIAQLVFYEQLSSAETGRIMHIPGATVRWRLAAIRKVLARIVEENQ